VAGTVSLRTGRRLLAAALLLALLFSGGAPGLARAEATEAAQDSWRLFTDRTAALYRDGRYEEARAVALQALEVAEKTFGPEHVKTATSLNILAEVDRVMGRYAEAEPLYRRALAIRERSLRPGSPEIAQVLNNLALLYYEMGRFADAEPMNRRALMIVIDALGIEHPYTATCMNNLGGLYVSLGRYPEAEKLYRWALEVRQKSLGKGHPDVAQVLNNLGELYLLLGRHAEAEPLYARALTILESSLGGGHPGLAPALNNLALLYSEMGRYDDAASLYRRALLLIERSFGTGHPRHAMGLNNLAELYRKAGKLSEAEALFRSALAALERAVGPRHPDTVMVLHNLATLEAGEGKGREALAHFRAALEAEDFMADTVFSLSSEREKFQYLDSLRASSDAFLSLAAGTLRTVEGAVREGWILQIRRKGVILDSLSRERDALFAAAGPDVRARYEEYRSVCAKIAKIATAGSEATRPALEELELRKERLERALADISAGYRSSLRARSAGPDEVAAALPEGSVLVDYACLQELSSRGQGRKLLAFVVPASKAGAAPLLVDLGDAAVIESAVREFREEMARVPKLLRSGLFDEAGEAEELSRASRRLYDLAFLPVRKAVGGAVRLFISPDGELNLIPFGVLEDEEGRPLIERYEIGYLSSARDVMRWGEKERNSGARIVVADPAYRLPRREPGGAPAQEPSPGGPPARSWPALPGTAQEASIISGIFPDAVCHLGAEATEELIKSLAPPELLHIATHGFFLSDEWQVRRARSSLSGNPLLRSGLVLAGAGNLGEAEPPGGAEDGILTALEISGLSLRGTGLVVLSACETGVGSARIGEGVFGLRRAFQLTGARTVVMSLWSIPDQETGALMGEFYRRLGSGEGKSEALRNASLAVRRARLASKGACHPFFWGAFISAGEP